MLKLVQNENSDYYALKLQSNNILTQNKGPNTKLFVSILNCNIEQSITILKFIDWPQSESQWDLRHTQIIYKLASDKYLFP